MAVNAGRPPYSNTGVERPNGGQVLVGLDWLEWTAGAGSSVLEVLPEAGGVTVQVLGHGMNGYRRVEQVLGVKVLSAGGAPGMGVHFIVGGEALRVLEAVHGVPKDELLRRVVEIHGGRLTRLDVAIDAVNCGVKREFIQRAYEQRAIVSRLRTWDQRAPRDMDGEYLAGWSFYLGERSGTYVNIYDKRAEQMADGHTAVRLLDDWVRFEWRLKKRQAEGFARVWLAGDWERIRSGLTGIMDFVDVVEVRRRRCPRVAWYADVMGRVERGRVVLPEEVWNAEASLEWAKRVAGKTVLKYARATGRSCCEIASELAEYGRDRWDAGDDRDIEQWRESV